jgi:hypothetical protein
MPPSSADWRRFATDWARTSPSRAGSTGTRRPVEREYTWVFWSSRATVKICGSGRCTWTERPLAIAGDHFVHGEGDRFESGEAANLRDDGGLRSIDARGAGAEGGGEAIPQAVFGFVEEESEDGDAAEAAEQDGGEDGWEDAALACGFGVNRRHAELDGDCDGALDRVLKKSESVEEIVPQGLKPTHFGPFTARLKSCPDTRCGFFRKL